MKNKMGCVASYLSRAKDEVTFDQVFVPPGSESTRLSCTVASQPAPAAIHRPANCRNKGAAQRHRAPITASASMSAPQRYMFFALSQSNASQAPDRLREITCPNGQGSARQHTPQPLQGAPSAGLSGASGWM